MMFCDGRFCNVLHVGFGFFLIFTAFDTLGNTEKTLLDSAQNDDPSFTANAYTSLGILYIVFAIGNWFCPVIIDFIGPRAAMVVASLTYVAYIASFLSNSSWVIYGASALMGFGASVMWTGEGTYLTMNSDQSTITRNAGIFWSIYQAAMLFGNIYVYYALEGVTKIDGRTRNQFTYVMIGIATAGVLLLCTLRPARTSEGGAVVRVRVGPMRAMKDALEVLKRPEMQLTLPLFLYFGLFVSFSTAVYSPSIGATLSLGDAAKSLVGLSGCALGAGEISGSLLMSALGHRVEKWGRIYIVTLGFLIQLVTYVFIFLNLPNSSSFGDTHDSAYLTSSGTLAIVCSGTNGFGLSFVSNVIYSTLGTVYDDHASAGFSIFYFCLSFGSAAAFFYSSYLGLHIQIGIMVAVGLVGVAMYGVAEFIVSQKQMSIPTERSCEYTRAPFKVEDLLQFTSLRDGH